MVMPVSFNAIYLGAKSSSYRPKDSDTDKTFYCVNFMTPDEELLSLNCSESVFNEILSSAERFHKYVFMASYCEYGSSHFLRLLGIGNEIGVE